MKVLAMAASTKCGISTEQLTESPLVLWHLRRHQAGPARPLLVQPDGDSSGPKTEACGHAHPQSRHGHPDTHLQDYADSFGDGRKV